MVQLINMVQVQLIQAVQPSQLFQLGQHQALL
eukprot:CAMPEP_0115102604 /NCGR_PEP_ID=MMETSP0227-20121206/34013_1 /TAXON_ID=89957 /ORGANISM="Polarella glacialis, Strain CCMP 1383" /LENGTH=31 /DNA_ID= /DNA_START= /DNA_END= /DNA_ORIENTATION=